MTVDLKKKLKNLPSDPGVYQMLDARGTILYVGKARRLKQRVQSYFRKNLDSTKTEALMAQVVDFKVIITGSDNEALLLESNLIKEHHPRYNVLLRDDKSYPYIFLSEGTFPRMDFHRGAKRAKGRYFGPYPNAGSVRENLAMIQKLFKLRQCSDSFFKHRTRPCLQYQIKRCTAPCVDVVTKEEYAKQVQHAIFFLEGKNEAIMRDINKQMDIASQEREYEKAAHLRDLLVRLRKFSTKQFITGDKGDIDIIGVAQKQGQTCVSVLFVRAGRVIGHKAFFPNVPPTADEEQVLSEFMPQYYLNPIRKNELVERIIVCTNLAERHWIQEALQEALERKIHISDRKLAKFQRWRSMAQMNARFALAQQLIEKNNVTQKLELLQKALKLPNPIERIECFDVSHTMGEATVASCVVYGVEGPLNKEYRRFNIKNVKAGDDYAAMKQALTRRYTRVKEGDGVLPDLLIIDGGKGQLKQAQAVMEELQVSGVILLGVAKGRSRKPGMETLFLNDKDTVIEMEGDEPALHLIQFIRDESHRFAITAHRKQRSKARSHSSLEDVEGVGAKRRRDLLRHFGGLQEIKKAGVADIMKVKGISQALAQKIYDTFHT